MGEVYRARDTRLDRTVALKLLAGELAQMPGRRIERFRQEARAIARITHPHICTLHDVGDDGSAIFLVMEFVEGATLARRLEDGPLPLALALRTGAQLADALDHAHRHGVVHRDLKPSNIMLTRDGAKLLDFGLAKLREPDERITEDLTSSALTDPGSIVGTVPYMAPEQIEGGEADARTDIFSLGVVLFEMVSGRRPFTGDSRASIMAAIVAAEPPALSVPQSRVPAALEHAIRRCLAKDPADRWQTARDLAAEFRWIAETGSGMGRAAGAGRPRRAVLWGGVAAAALVAAAVAAMVPSRAPGAPIASFRQVTYRKGAVTSARFAPDGHSFVYSAAWEGQPYATFLGRAESPDARDLQLAETRILSISRTGDMAVLFAAQNISRAFGERTLARIPMAGGARRDVLTGVVDADWVPGTDTLAVVRDPGAGRPWTVEFPIGTTVHEATAAWSLRVSPDGSRVAFFEGPAVFDSAPAAMITVVDRAGRKATVSRDLAGMGLAWAPSGREIWFTGARPVQQSVGPQLHAVSLDGVERLVYSAPDWLVLHDIAADGTVLLSRNSIRINAACQAAGDPTERELGWLTASFANGVSPDGRVVIFSDPLTGRTASGDAMLYRRTTDGAPAVALGAVRGFASLSPDGQWVLAQRKDNLILIPVGAGATVTLPNGGVVALGRGAWLSDSKHIVYTGDNGDGAFRGYLQAIPDGLPRAVTPAGVALGGKAAVRDNATLLGRVKGVWSLLPVHGGEARPLPGLSPRDLPVQWSDHGRFLYTVDAGAEPTSPAVEVMRVDIASGARVRWKTLAPPDAVGVQALPGTVVIAAEGRSYCYSYMRRLGDLFVVQGLR
jgi:hypothetical protein